MRECWESMCGEDYVCGWPVCAQAIVVKRGCDEEEVSLMLNDILTYDSNTLRAYLGGG